MQPRRYWRGPRCGDGSVCGGEEGGPHEQGFGEGLDSEDRSGGGLHQLQGLV